MYFRRNKDRTAFGAVDIENLISVLRSRNQNESFSRATSICDRALNGPQSTSIRFRNILYWPLDVLLRRRLGKLAEELKAVYEEALSEPELLNSADMGKLGVSWALILELVLAIINILMEMREKRQATEEDDSSGPTEEPEA